MNLALVLLATVTAAQPTTLDTIREEAARLEPLARAGWTSEFLRATARLPAVAPRVFYRAADRSRWWPEKEALALPEAERAAMQRVEVGDDVYYGRYGTPLAYLRPLEILAAERFEPRGRRIVDFGYGNVGQLKLLALLGADAVGIEVDPLLPLLYSAEDGPVPTAAPPQGSLRIPHGRFPADAGLVRDVGEGYSLFLSKNTLKRGYVHPE